MNLRNAFSMSLGNEFCNEVLWNPCFVGDVIEFGTGPGHSAEWFYCSLREQKRIVTFDGFVGLPKTNKIVPRNSHWEEGNLRFDEETVRTRLAIYPNITVVKTMMSDLKHPFDYGISKIAGVNIDLDLYEGTVDALKFIDKCEWRDLLIRFDDWGAHPNVHIPAEIAEHEQAAFFEFIEEKKYRFFFYDQYNREIQYTQVLVKISR